MMNDWTKLFGTPDLDKFDEYQRSQLLEGLSEGLPYQLYADPKLSAFEMKEFRVLLSRTKLAREGPAAALRAGMHPGFKNYLNYKLYPDEICYIPEHWDMEEDGPGYTANDILKLCNDDQDLADMVFSLCDWQHPSTVLDELDRDDDLALLRLKKEKLELLQAEIAGIEQSLEPDLPPTVLYLDAETPAKDITVESITFLFPDRTTAMLKWKENFGILEEPQHLFRGKFIDLTLDGAPLAGHIGKLDGAIIQSVSVYSKESPGVPFRITELEFRDGNQNLYFDIDGYMLVQTNSEARFKNDLHSCQANDPLENKIHNADYRCQNQFTTRNDAWKEDLIR